MRSITCHCLPHVITINPTKYAPKETDLETGQRPDCVNVLHCAVICVQPRVRAHDSSQCFAVYTQPNPQ